MPRRVPEQRLKELLESATRVFINQGYRRTQMSDVAEALGVAKGTLYLYVESKEALFDAALRFADAEIPSASEFQLPLPTREPGALLAELRERLAREAAPASLLAALRRRRVDDARAELAAILRDLFATASRHRTAIKLIDRCGRDHPELAAAFYEGGRFTQLDLLVRYLEPRIRSGQLRSVPDAAVAARFVIETISTWAIHIHWDPAPQPIDPGEAEETVVHFLLAGLLPSPTGRATTPEDSP